MKHILRNSALVLKLIGKNLLKYKEIEKEGQYNKK